ncbi:MAG: ABC transporter permease [Lachnospira sp.]|nr:ABC transporter permease [Lachnospira sp.]
MKKIKKHRMLFALQMKAAFMALPKIMAGMLVFAVLMVIMAIALVKVTESTDDKANVMKVGVVYPQSEESKEENMYIEQAFGMLENVDAVKEACTFVNYYSEENALQDMKASNINAVIVLPEKFISSILYGENTPARIVFPSSDVNNSSVVFREILRSAASDLSSAQAGIYAVDDTISELGGSDKDRENANTYMNLRYIAYVIDREAYYEVVDVNGDRASSAVQFYTATGMLLFLLMGGITCVELLKSEGRVLNVALKRFGVTPGANHIYKVLGVSTVFWTVISVVYALVSLMVVRFPVVAKAVTVVGSIKETVVNSDGSKKLIIQYNDAALTDVLLGVCALAVLMLAVFSFAGVIFRIAGKSVSGVILLFLLSVVMMFCAGCFMPISMLPSVVGKIGTITPIRYMFDMCNQILTGSVELLTVGINALFAVAFMGIVAFMENRV